MRMTILLALALLLTGCAGLDAARQYRGTELQSFVNMEDTWRVFDRPAEGRLMITPSLGTITVDALTSGPFGIFHPEIPKSIYQQAVEGWLVQTGRSCKVTDGYKLIKPQWEFRYSC